MLFACDMLMHVTLKSTKWVILCNRKETIPEAKSFVLHGKYMYERRKKTIRTFILKSTQKQWRKKNLTE